MQHKHSATIFYVLVSPISKDESVRLKNIIATITHHFRQKAQYQDILPSARPLVIPHMNPPTVSPHPSLAKNPNLWVLCQVLVKVRVFTNPKTKNTISTEVIKTESIIWLLMAYFYDIINNIDRKLPYYCFSLIKQHPKIISIKSDFIKLHNILPFSPTTSKEWKVTKVELTICMLMRALFQYTSMNELVKSLVPVRW